MGYVRSWGVLAVSLIWANLAAAAEPTPAGDPLSPVPDAIATAAVPAEPCACPQPGCHGCVGHPCGGCGDGGCFNCSCRGSYKFPVPPLYTYHWPGLYSQKTMVEPWKPYRFPPLAAPTWNDPAPASAAVRGPTWRQTANECVLESPNAGEPESLSSRFQRLSEPRIE